MTRGNFCFIIVALWMFGSIPGRAHAQATLTLEEAVSLAVEHSREVQAKALQPGEIQQQIASMQAQRLPQFKATALVGELLDHPSLTFARGVFGNGIDGSFIPQQAVRLRAPERPIAIPFLQGNFALSQQYRMALDVKKLQLEKKLRAEEVRATRAEVVAAVKNVYYRLVLNRFSLDAAERNVNVYKEMERITLRYVSEKTVLKADLLEVQARHARAEYEATLVRDGIAEGKEELNSLLGRPIDLDFDVAPVESPESSLQNVEELRQRALAKSPAIRQAQLRVEEAGVARRIKKSEYIPDVSLNVGYLGVTGLPSIFPQKFAVAGVLVDWQPFDWGRKKHESAELDEKQQEASLVLKEEEDRVRIEVGKQWRKLNEARQFLAAARVNEDRARDDVRVVQARYSQNAALMKSVLESQAAASGAHEQTEKALIEWWQAQTNLDKTIGEKE
jgi:outer membrane protein